MRTNKLSLNQALKTLGDDFEIHPFLDIVEKGEIPMYVRSIKWFLTDAIKVCGKNLLNKDTLSFIDNQNIYGCLFEKKIISGTCSYVRNIVTEDFFTIPYLNQINEFKSDIAPVKSKVELENLNQQVKLKFILCLFRLYEQNILDILDKEIQFKIPNADELKTDNEIELCKSFIDYYEEIENENSLASIKIYDSDVYEQLKSIYDAIFIIMKDGKNCKSTINIQVKSMSAEVLKDELFFYEDDILVLQGLPTHEQEIKRLNAEKNQLNQDIESITKQLKENHVALTDIEERNKEIELLKVETAEIAELKNKLKTWRPAFKFESPGLNALYSIIEKYYLDNAGNQKDIKYPSQLPPKSEVYNEFKSNWLNVEDRTFSVIDRMIHGLDRSKRNTQRVLKVVRVNDDNESDEELIKLKSDNKDKTRQDNTNNMYQ